MEVLDSLAEQLVEQHERFYLIAVKNFSERIVSSEEKITSAEKIVKAQKEFRKVMGKRIKEVEAGIIDYEKLIRDLNFEKANITELYNGSSPISLLRSLPDFYRLKAEEAD